MGLFTFADRRELAGQWSRRTFLVRPRHDASSPSGRFVARLVRARDTRGKRLLRPIVLDARGVVVCRAAPVPARGIRVCWEPHLDTLWISTAGEVSFVQEGLFGWSQTRLGDDLRRLVPAEAR